MRALATALLGTASVFAAAGRLAAALTGAVLLGGLVAMCWVIGSNARTDRFLKIIGAARDLARSSSAEPLSRDVCGSKIFINYRDEDEPFVAALIDHELSSAFGSSRVFRDSKSIRLGDDFAEIILASVRQSKALLVVLGPRWLDAADAAGRRRLDNPYDWVRLEIAEALRHGVRVIPVLVAVDMPRAGELPEDIAALTRCQYLHLHHRDSRHDIARLVAELIELVPGLVPASSRSSRPWRRARVAVGSDPT